MELLGYQARLSNIDHTFLNNERRALSPSYACAEFVWYLSADPRIKMIKAYAPQYERFAEDGIAHGAYGTRIRMNNIHGDQFSFLIQTLKMRNETRQAVVTLFDPSKDQVYAETGIKKDIPCTISWQFLIRENKLHMITTMRSQDVWLGMPYDVFVNTCIQRVIAKSLGVMPGTYTHQIGSLHLYQKHFDAAAEVEPTVSLPLGWESAPTLQGAYGLVDIEHEIRLSKPTCFGHLTTMQYDICSCIAAHFNRHFDIHSPALKKGLETYANRGRK